MGVAAVPSWPHALLRLMAAFEPTNELGVAAVLLGVVDAPVPPFREGVGVEARLRFVELQHELIFHFWTSLQVTTGAL